jgi:CheY-like chemotaxis protein
VSSPRTILVVNDQPGLLKGAGKLLRDAGYSVLEAANGADALELAREQTPSLVLLDLVMPGIDGYEVCRRLKFNPSTKAIPVVVMTGHKLTADDRTVGLNAGADAYITLPLQRDELLETVSSFF